MIMDENPLSGRLVVLTCTVETRDMSVGDKRSFTMTVDADTLTAGQRVDASRISAGPVTVTAISPERVVLNCEGEELAADYETSAEGDAYATDNGYIRQTRTFTLEYAETVSYRLIEAIISIMKVHDRETKFPCAKTLGRQMRVIGQIDALIAQGRVHLYPLKALLVTADDWQTGKIERKATFMSIMGEGIAKGCLAPDSDGWEWLRFLSVTNNPFEYFTDRAALRRMVSEASDSGNEAAGMMSGLLDDWELRERHDAMFLLINEIGDARQKGHPVVDEALKKSMVMESLDSFIAAGEKGFYPLKGMLASMDDWSSGQPFDEELFRSILAEGIGKGALAPDDSKGWAYMKTAADYIDPLEYHKYLRLLGDLLDRAIMNGDNNACQTKSLLEKDFTER